MVGTTNALENLGELIVRSGNTVASLLSEKEREEVWKAISELANEEVKGMKYNRHMTYELD